MRPLIEDFPSQFKGKPKIEALCACFDRQFAEIEQFSGQEPELEPRMTFIAF